METLFICFESDRLLSMPRAFLGSRLWRWPLMVVLALATLMLFYTSKLLSSNTLTVEPVRAALSPSWLKTVIYESDVSEYDVDEVLRWHRSSQCSGLQNVFVGDQPLYPPCQPDTPPGIPTLGRYPFVGPFPYVKNSKNPCWRQGGMLTCVPYFFLVGVSKSGTSDLNNRINMHPDVISTVKEPHWFDRMRYHTTSYHHGAPPPQDFRVYTGHYAKVSAAVEKDIHTSGESVKICGDASPSQFYDNNEWPLYSGNEGCTEPRIILANHLRHLNPDVKIILIIRHPVDRLYSRYLFDNQPPKLRRDPPSPKKFHNYVIDGLRKYRDCFNRWSLRHCVYNKSLSESVHELRIQESLYPVFLEDWLRVIPRKQMLLIRFEDYKQNITKELIRTYQFLGLDMGDVSNRLDGIVSQEIKNQGKLKKKVKPMLENTERLLNEFYQPFITRLSSLLEDDKFLWKDLKPGT